MQRHTDSTLQLSSLFLTPTFEMAPSDLFLVPDNLADRCDREYGWNSSMANKAIQGYQDLMKLKMLHQDWEGKILSPSSIVDKVWHLHLLELQQGVSRLLWCCHRP